jgi:hypothetical protein
MRAYGVKQETTDTTSPLTCTSVTGFPRMKSVFASGEQVLVSLLTSDGYPRAIALATMTHSGGDEELALDTILVSWNGTTYDNTTPALPTLTGTTTVIVTEPPNSGPLTIPYVSDNNTMTVTNARSPYPANGSLTTTADRVYYVPFLWLGQQKITHLCYRCVTTAGGGKSRVGIYTVGSDGEPETLLVSTGDITPANATSHETSVTAFTLPVGWYYIAYVGDLADSIGACVTNYFMVGPNGCSYGSSGANPGAMFYEASASWTTLPASPSASLTWVNSGASRSPNLWCKVSA